MRTRWKTSSAPWSACRIFSAAPRRRARVFESVVSRNVVPKDLNMRPLILAAALAFSALAATAPALADDLRPSQAVCDAKKLGGRELADCLRAEAERADKELAGVIDAAIKSIDARPGL